MCALVAAVDVVESHWKPKNSSFTQVSKNKNPKEQPFLIWLAWFHRFSTLRPKVGKLLVLIASCQLGYVALCNRQNYLYHMLEYWEKPGGVRETKTVQKRWDYAWHQRTTSIGSQEWSNNVRATWSPFNLVATVKCVKPTARKENGDPAATAMCCWQNSKFIYKNDHF